MARPTFVLAVICFCMLSVQGEAFHFNSALRRDHALTEKGLAKKPQSTELITENRLKMHLSAGTVLLGITGSSAGGKSISQRVANIIGYFMGYGSVCLYLPIVYDLYKKKNADGISVATWVTSLVGLMLSCVYPLQKHFPISSYMESLVLSVECYFILGSICFLKKLYKQFIAISILFLSFIGVMLNFKLPDTILSAMQILSMISCNYALVPQIMLNIQRKTYGWSEITALLSSSGNALRIFTTLQLTRDPLVLFGYFVGFAMNFLIFLQYFIYPKR